MKKFLPYLIGVLLLGGIVALFLTDGKKRKKQRRFDERITLRRQDKIPYGTYVAFQSLGDLFPSATVHINREEPGYWDSLSQYDPNQALIIITGKFNADRTEMEKLIAFVEKGNDVFISARMLSYPVFDMLNCKVKDNYISSLNERAGREDSLVLGFERIAYPPDTGYSYSGRKLDASFYDFDDDVTEVLGRDGDGAPNFIHLKAGRGHLYVHLAPLAFSNYFLLHKKNIDYYEKALSVISPNVEKIAWDEYYLNKRNYDEPETEKRGWYSVLMNTQNENGQRSFRAALWVLLALLLLYVLLEMRRKQRYIPVVAPPRNDSLDFVKTIGRLYFDKGDHRNLCRKMSAYFLEHVRSRYKLNTVILDDEFVKKLQYKSGVPEPEILPIVTFIQHLDIAEGISPKQLADFHQQLENFYSKT